MGWGRLSPSLGMRENPSHRRVHGAWKMGAVSTFLRPSLLVMSPGCSFRGCLQKLPFQAWESRLRLGILSQCLSLQETLQNLPTEVLPNCHLPQAPWAATFWSARPGAHSSPVPPRLQASRKHKPACLHKQTTSGFGLQTKPPGGKGGFLLGRRNRRQEIQIPC